MNVCTACSIQYPWGIKAGYPGSPGGKHATPYGQAIYNRGLGGASGGNAYTFKCMYEAGQGNPVLEYIRCTTIPESPYRTDIAGSHTEVNGPGTFGYYGSPNAAGGGGGLIIKWSTAFGAAPPTGFPGASDISADTPGYYTYCFTSGGSIELP